MAAVGEAAHEALCQRVLGGENATGWWREHAQLALNNRHRRRDAVSVVQQGGEAGGAGGTLVKSVGAKAEHQPRAGGGKTAGGRASNARQLPCGRST